MNLTLEEQKYLSLAPFYIPSLFDINLSKLVLPQTAPEKRLILEKGHKLLQPESTPNQVYFLTSGVVIDSTSNLNGLERFTLVFPGYPIGFHAVIHQQPILYTSTAHTRCEVIALSLDDMLSLMQQDKELLHGFLKLAALETRYTNNIVMQNNACSTFEKIAQTLYFYYLTQKHFPPLMELKLTQHLLAGLAGVHRTSVGLAMKDLKDQGIVSMDKKNLLIHQPDALKQIAFPHDLF